MTAPRDWRKSSRSGQQEDCIQVASDLNALRDSKHPVVELTADVMSFVASIKRGDLGR